jgi:hypothetical protein
MQESDAKSGREDGEQGIGKRHSESQEFGKGVEINRA